MGKSTGVSVVYLLPFIALPLLLLGFELLRRGRWPRRVGTTPHCRKCAYILTGLEADRCPECGNIIAGGGILVGERHRRPALAWIGAILTLLGLALLVLIASGTLSRVDWNRYKPLSWLLRQADSPVPVDSTYAWAEIQRRVTGNLLSDSQQDMLVERGLQAQQSTAISSYDDMLFALIAKRYADHKLSAAQEQRFFDNALKVDIQVRPVVGSLDPISYWIHGRGRGPARWWTQQRVIEWQMDQGKIEKGTGSNGGSLGGWGSGSTFPPQPAGKHHLRLKYELTTFATPQVSPPYSGHYEKVVTRDLQADFVSVEGHAPITTIGTPPAAVLLPLFGARLSVSKSYLSLSLDAKALPVDTAFEGFIRVGGKEYPCSSVDFRKGTPGGYSTGTNKFPKPMPPKADLILRSSERVARGTTDLTQIWQGEIVLRDIPVQRAAPASTASASE
jgi:hypothetical protein